MKYNLTKRDFETAFNFAVNYHLDPTKSGTTRTAGSARGLGDVLDSFLAGKVVEIGVINIIQSFNTSKKCLLDFDLKPINEVKDEPDIISVMEAEVQRIPKLFVEIKNTSPDDRWIGLTLEQFETMKSSAGDPEKIYIIGASIENVDLEKNFKEKDLLGMYLKSISDSDDFSKFADLTKTFVKIEYVISGQELDKHGVVYPKGGLFYETDIFVEVSGLIKKQIEQNRHNAIEVVNDELEKYSPNISYPVPDAFGKIEFTGKIKIFEKKNEKSVRRFIYAETDVDVFNKVLGKFHLDEGKYYYFNLSTVGRNPVLARNNIWIAKRSLPYSIKKGLIKSDEENLKEVADNI